MVKAPHATVGKEVQGGGCGLFKVMQRVSDRIGNRLALLTQNRCSLVAALATRIPAWGWLGQNSKPETDEGAELDRWYGLG